LLWIGTAHAATTRGGENLLDERPPAPVMELRPGPAAEPAAAQPEPVLGNPLWSIPVRALSATRERPIFSPSRRPPPPVIANVPVAKPLAVPVAAAPPEPLALRLIGTIATPNGGIAILSEDSVRPSIRLRLGESHSGWVLREVQSREVSLEKGDRIETIVLQRDNVSSNIGDPPAPVDPASFLKGMKSGR
jgi:general secretion pathway protein N